MITEQEDQKAKWYYSQGRIDFEELISILNGRIALEVLEAERLAL